MATEQEIKDILYDWLHAAVPSIDVIWANQPDKGQSIGAPQPTGTYASLNLIAGPQRVGLSDEERPPDIDNPSEELIITGQRKLTLSVQFYGSGAYDYAVAAQNSLQDQDVRDLLKRRQTAQITVDTPTIAGNDYVITIDGVPITIEAVSSLSLDGNGYASRDLSVTPLDFPDVIEFRFKPSFSPNDGATYLFFDLISSGGSTRVIISKDSASNELLVRVRVDGVNKFPVDILLADYLSYWNDLDWNILRIVLNRRNDSKAILNNVELDNQNALIGYAEPAIFNNILIVAAGGGGAAPYEGLIDYLRIASTEDNMDAGTYLYDWEFNGDYTEEVASFDLTAQGTGNSFDLDDTEEVRDNLIVSINDSEFINTTATTGAPSGELNIEGKIGSEYSLGVTSNITIGTQVSAVDLAVVGDNGIIDLTELLNTSWEQRKVMDVFFRTHTSIVKTPDYIENVEITGTVSDNEITINVET